MPVIRKPERTKNRSTPNHPWAISRVSTRGATFSSAPRDWSSGVKTCISMTMRTAMARTPSSSGMYRGSRVNKDLLFIQLVLSGLESAQEKRKETDSLTVAARLRANVSGRLVRGGDLVGFRDLQ